MSLENTPSFLLNFSTADMNGAEKKTYRFKSFRLDTAERQLFNNGTPISLTPKAFDVLTLLVTRAAHLVEKEEMMREVWADSFVEEANLPRIIHTLRKALEEDENGNKFIETVPKKGYRFVAELDDAIPVVVRNGNGHSVANDLWPDLVESPESERAAIPSTKRISRLTLLAGLVALLVISALAVLVYVQNPWATPATGVSIAVLPFRPVTDSQTHDPAHDLNFAYSLILRLKEVKNLKVRSFNAVSDYQTGQDPALVGREQKVDYVVVSSYTLAGGRLRVASDIYNVKTGSVEETLYYDRVVADVYGAGDIVAEAFSEKVLAKLNLDPIEPAANRRTKSEKAWNHYVYGSMLNNKRIKEDSEKAAAEFENAVRIDPDFAEAYVGLAHAHEASFINGGVKSVHCPPMTEAVDRAIALAPNLGEAYTMKARNLRMCFGDRTSPTGLHDKAAELAPNSAFVRRFRGIHFMNQGKSDEALAELKTALDLEPTVPWTEKLIARALYFAGRYAEAIEQLKKTTQLDPLDAEQPEYMMMCHALKGDVAQAFEWFLVMEVTKNTSQGEIDSFKRVYSESGWPGVLRARLERAENSERAGGKNYGELASLAAQVGDNDKAFLYLEKREAGEKVEPTIGNLRQEPTFDPLRSDPRFERLLAGK